MIRLSEPDSLNIFQKRIWWLSLFVVFLFFVLLLRLWYLQIINGKQYRKRSENNRIRLKEIPAYRGKILDRNGLVLVDNKPSYALYIIPEEVDDLGLLLNRLSKIIGLDPQSIQKKILRIRNHFSFKPVCIKRDISLDDVSRIESNILMLPGTIIRVEGKRNYIYKELAAHLIGYISRNIRGKSGIEYRWEKVLSGEPGGMQIEVDATGRMIDVISKSPSIPGADVYLTIDKRLQQKAEQLLKGKRGAIVAMDPYNGEILAMASSPSFDPNIFVDGMDQKTWQKISNSMDHPLQNRAINGLYPPASLFKVVVSSAGLQEGMITPRKKFICTGRFLYGNWIYNCWKRNGHGEVDLHKAIRESCDIYFYNLGKMLGVDKIAHYARMFGLGRKTGIDVGNESTGLVPTSRWKLKRFGVPWQGGETLSLAIGQSYLLVTPIQMAVMYSAVFNGGILYKPQVTKLIKRPNGDIIHRFKPQIKGRLHIKPEYLDIIKQALIAVVNEPHGTGIKAKIKGITVAGKTGTVQLMEKKKKEEKEERHNEIKDHAWFVGVAPAKHPSIVVAVIIEHGGHGGSASAPIARELIREFLKPHVR